MGQYEDLITNVYDKLDRKQDYSKNEKYHEFFINNPDYIIITGDTIDNPKITKEKDKIKLLLKFFENIKKDTKIIIGLGNHDITTENDKLFFQNLNELENIFFLDNDKYEDNLIYISGITLPHNYYYNITKKESPEVLIEHLYRCDNLIKKLPKEKFKISLIHSPINLTNKQALNLLKEYDLILSGHTHNGMVPDLLEKLFKNNSGLIAPNKNLFPKIVKGKIEKNNLTIIINGGITKLSLSSAKILNKLNFIYNMSINKITVKKRGK